MLRFLFLLTALSLSASAAELWLLEGDHLRVSEAIRIEQDRLQVPDRKLEVPLNRVEGLMFDRPDTPELYPQQLTLRNSNLLLGQFSGGEETWTWQSSWGQSLTLNPLYLESLAFFRKGEGLLWTQTEEAESWEFKLNRNSTASEPRFRPGVMHIPGNSELVRKLDQAPGPFRMELLLDVDFGFPSWYFRGFYQTMEDLHKPVLNFNMSPNRIQFVNRGEIGSRLDSMTGLIRPSLGEQPSKVRFRLDGDPQRGIFRLWLGDIHVFDWQGPHQRKDGELDPLRYVSLGMSGYRTEYVKVKSARFWLRPFPPEALEPDHDSDLDRIQLTNGDFLEGKLLSANEKSIRFEVQGAGEVDLPHSGLLELVLSGQEKAVPRIHARDVTLYLISGGEITLELSQLDQGKLRGRHEAFAEEVEVPLASLRAIRFNTHMLDVGTRWQPLDPKGRVLP